MSNFVPIEGQERDNLILDILKNAHNYSKTDAGVERWERGWGENLEAFKSNHELKSLIPRYIRPGKPMRIDSQFVQPIDPDYELKWYDQFTTDFFDKWLSGFTAIYEFGCGSCVNLAKLGSKLHGSTTRIVGLDWSDSSMAIANMLGQIKCPNVSGRKFDFFNPDYDIKIDDRAVFLTVGALEQTGDLWQPFLDFILSKRPKRVCHIEPVFEWYDPNNLVDYTAMVAHEARGFQKGYLPALEKLEKAGMINILHKERTGVGSLIIEGYSQIVWEPV